MLTEPEEGGESTQVTMTFGSYTYSYSTAIQASAGPLAH